MLLLCVVCLLLYIECCVIIIIIIFFKLFFVCVRLCVRGVVDCSLSVVGCSFLSFVVRWLLVGLYCMLPDACLMYLV